MPTFNSLATDNFNRANNADLGANWDAGYTSLDPWKIQSNLATPTNAGTNAMESYNAITWPDDQYVQFKISTWANENVAGAILRAANPATVTAYFCMTEEFAGTNLANKIVKYLSGASTLLASDTSIGAWVNNDVLRGWVLNTDLYLDKNGTEQLSASDSDISSGRGGIRGLYFSGGAGGQVFLDDWDGGEVVGDGGIVIPVFVHHYRQQGFM